MSSRTPTFNVMISKKRSHSAIRQRNRACFVVFADFSRYYIVGPDTLVSMERSSGGVNALKSEEEWHC